MKLTHTVHFQISPIRWSRKDSKGVTLKATSLANTNQSILLLAYWQNAFMLIFFLLLLLCFLGHVSLHILQYLLHQLWVSFTCMHYGEFDRAHRWSYLVVYWRVLFDLNTRFPNRLHNLRECMCKYTCGVHSAYAWEYQRMGAWWWP